MKIYSFVISAMLLLPAISQATAMSPQLSKCLSIEKISDAHKAWSEDADKFLVDKTLSPEGKFQVAKSGVKKVLANIDRIKALAEIQGHDPLTEDAKRLLADIQYGDITQSNALNVLMRGLPKLKDRLDDLIYRAETRIDCSSMPKNNQSRRSNVPSGISTGGAVR